MNEHTVQFVCACVRVCACMHACVRDSCIYQNKNYMITAVRVVHYNYKHTSVADEQLHNTITGMY